MNVTSLMLLCVRIPAREQNQFPFQIRCLPVQLGLAERQ